MLDKINAIITGSGHQGEPVRMFVAGGIAVHYYCGTRYTSDVDATFSHRLLMPHGKLIVDYVREGGVRATLYLDPTYNDTFALLHPDHRESAMEWDGIGNERRMIHLHALSPVDLAVSKISRFSPQDREDIHALARQGLITSSILRTRALEALDCYVGDTRWVRGTIDLICDDVATLNR
jgi:hypothetical protein